MSYIFLILLLIIFYQDLKDRQVTLLVLVAAMLVGGYLYYTNSFYELFIFNIGVNSLLIVLISAILFLYTRLKLKLSFFDAIGLGDLLFFMVLAVSFPTLAFVTLFSLSLLFSLVLFLILKPKLTKPTVPLAGFQALFLFLILFINLVLDIVPIYAY